MDGEWPLVPIGSVARIYDGPHATPPTQSEGPIYLGIDTLDNGRLNLAATKHVSRDVFNKWTRRVKPEPGDLVFSYETRIGQAALVPEGLECCLGRRLALVRPDRSKLLPTWLLYYFLGPSFQDVLRAHTKPGSTVDRIHLTDFPSFPIAVPPLTEQERITDLLCALDEKVELNRRVMETLEATGQALFKSWFVDFDPVYAKVEGRRTGLPDEIADLFPSSIDASGRPTGWKIEPLLEHARLISGGTPKTDEPDYWNGDLPWASAKDVSQCRTLFLTGTERSITERGLRESSTRVVPAFSTVVVARGATTGRSCLLARDMAMNQTCYALNSLKDVPFWLSCSFQETVASLVKAAHGSVFATITTSTLRRASIVVAPAGVTRAFERLVEPLFLAVLARTQEAARAASLRDTLLPKLISGQLRIRDAEQAVAEVA